MIYLNAEGLYLYMYAWSIWIKTCMKNKLCKFCIVPDSAEWYIMHNLIWILTRLPLDCFHWTLRSEDITNMITYLSWKSVSRSGNIHRSQGLLKYFFFKNIGHAGLKFWWQMSHILKFHVQRYFFQVIFTVYLQSFVFLDRYRKLFNEKIWNRKSLCASLIQPRSNEL